MGLFDLNFSFFFNFKVFDKKFNIFDYNSNIFDLIECILLILGVIRVTLLAAPEFFQTSFLRYELLFDSPKARTAISRSIDFWLRP